MMLYSQEFLSINYCHLFFIYFSKIILYIVLFHILHEISNILRRIISKLSIIFSFALANLFCDMNASIPPFTLSTALNPSHQRKVTWEKEKALPSGSAS